LLQALVEVNWQKASNNVRTGSSEGKGMSCRYLPATYILYLLLSHPLGHPLGCIHLQKLPQKFCYRTRWAKFIVVHNGRVPAPRPKPPPQFLFVEPLCVESKTEQLQQRLIPTWSELAPLAHHERWMVCSQDTIFCWVSVPELTMVVQLLFLIPTYRQPSELLVDRL
jgi:hypothetical protein